MVRLATVRSTFHARVIAARLGAEGIMVQLRGNVDGVYPMGDTHVYVEADALDTAREVLQVVEVSGGRISGITFFLDTAALFPLFGLPPRLGS